MPRFFFNIDGEQPDNVGTDLADAKALRGEAIKAAGEMLTDIDGALSGEEWKMTVLNDLGQTVMELRFSAIERSLP